MGKMNSDDVVHDLVGASPAIRETIDFIGKVAGKNTTVLIRGESGTGKELVARAIHWNSSHSAGPFVALNCAAVPEELLESEFFGFEKGAFTGAVAQKKGKIEMADGGTFFLDEVGDMKPSRMTSGSSIHGPTSPSLKTPGAIPRSVTFDYSFEANACWKPSASAAGIRPNRERRLQAPTR